VLPPLHTNTDCQSAIPSSITVKNCSLSILTLSHFQASRLSQEHQKRKLFIYDVGCDGDVSESKRRKTNPHTGLGPGVAANRLEAFVNVFYKGDLEPRPEAQADDVLVVLCKVDSQSTLRHHSLDKVRQLLRPLLSKRHTTVAIGTVEPVGEESMMRFRRFRRALGSRMEDKVSPLAGVCDS